MDFRQAGSWEEIGRRVAEARRAAGLTQRRLARAIGAEQTLISTFESGRRRINTLEIARIARELGRSIEWFLPEPPRAACGGLSRQAMADYEAWAEERGLL